MAISYAARYAIVSNHLTAVQTASTPVPTFFRAKSVRTGIPDNIGSKKSGNAGGGGLYNVSRCGSNNQISAIAQGGTGY